MNKVAKEKRVAISVKLSKEENEVIRKTANNHGETVSGYARRVLIESAENSIYTGKDVMRTLLEISYDMSRISVENFQEVISEINRRGEQICQILSSK